ncbi:hypothetical protein [Shewanella sp.]|uniref:hypothetical protein n=1 Tax=Shewanella sp. TaxID=50422 RepID=UPI003D097347
MNFEQIKTATINSFQLFFDSNGIELRVGELSDSDYVLLCRGYSDLNWDWAFEKFGNRDECISVGIKLVTSEVLDGAMMGVYDLERQTLYMHLMESFVNTEDHPLRGRMTYFTLVASFLFLSAFGGTTLMFVDPINEQLIAHYQRYGFSAPQMIDGETMQSIGFEALAAVIATEAAGMIDKP